MIKYFTTLLKKWKYSREKAKFMKSTEPWVSIRSDKVDHEKGLQLELDWNEAFIKYLRANGVKGTKEEDVVAYWLTMINSQFLGQEED